MDLYCPVCGEPWEFESLHEEARERYGISYYEEPDNQGYYYESPWFSKYNEDEYRKVFSEVSKEFRAVGCKALSTAFGLQNCSPQNAAEEKRDSIYGLTKSEAAGALYELLGDDLDGAAAMLDDMGF